jgi:hypothetical protein
MNIKRLITNKYTLSVIILVSCLLADIILHKGMSRAIITDNFTSKRNPVKLPVCTQMLIQKSKQWVQAVNTTERISRLPATTDGFEMDVYFDPSKNHFEVYHDSSNVSRALADELLEIYSRRKLSSSIWIDFKNLTPANSAAALQNLILVREKYHLQNKIIVESSDAQSLRRFCDSGFFTSYYVPFFNPYLLKEDELIQKIDFITQHIRQYPSSALSGYYFQYPVLKKFFPGYPLLTWTSNSNISIVANVFNLHLKNDPQVKIVLYPY